MSEWISVKDSLPHIYNHRYLTSSLKISDSDLDTEQNVFIFTKDDEWVRVTGYDIPHFITVTHWMELPEPPE